MVEFKPEDYEFNEDSEHSSDNPESDSEEPQITNKKRKHESNDEAESALSKRSGKKAKNELYKQPTAEEMTKLRETENLYNSNIFRLQIRELLDEIKIKPKLQSEFQVWCKAFEQALNELPEFPETNLSKLTVVNSKKKKLDKHQQFINYAATLVPQPCCFDVPMKFLRPKMIVEQGTLKNVPTEETKFATDLILVMNKDMFFEKDYLNNKYTVKKQYYMAYIQHFIQDFDCVDHVSIQNYLHNEQLTYLEVKPSQQEHMLVNIFVAPEVDTFKPNRFMPNKNNLKQFKHNDFPDFDLATFADSGTFLHNSVMLFDCTLQTNALSLDMLKSHGNVQDAIKLIIIWLRQRGLNNHYASFTSDLAVYIVAYLFSTKKINKLMSSYQVVRIFWSFVANLNEDDKLSLAIDVKPNDMALFEGHLILLDATGCYNVAAFLDKGVYLKVKAEARLAIESLDSNRFDSFASLFTTVMPVGLQYDAILKVRDAHRFRKVYWNCSDREKFKYFGFYDILVADYVAKQLKYALGQRIMELVPLFGGTNDIMAVGINLNPEHCHNVIEKGPRQYEAGAEEFKAFWGDLAELRRFKDSSICEAVYFGDVKTVQDKRLIFAKVIKFVMAKLELNYELNGAEMETILKPEHVAYSFPSGSNEEAILRIKGVLTGLDKLLRNLPLPLPITACQCTSDLCSYTDPFPPVATNYNLKKSNCSERGDFVVIDKAGMKLPHLCEPIECVLQLARNSKWPNTIDALRAMKTVYYFEIAKLLRTEHNVVASVRDDFVDVLHQGYVFRLRLHHPKEIGLLKKHVSADGMTFYRDTEESLRLERSLDVLPKVAGALNGLHQEHPSYGPSTCLIKRWLRAQMLDADHIGDVVINLLSASLFISSAPYGPAILPQVAFLRFLRFMSTFDHNIQTVVANFNNGLSAEELNEIDGRFLQDRRSFNALHIVAPFDAGKSLFTKSGPTAMVLRRIKCLAAETYGSLTNRTFSYQACFVPNLSGYDALIHLHASTNLRKHQQVYREHVAKIRVEEFDASVSRCLQVVGFDPVELYLKELRENYGEYALFFHDFYGGNVIGVLWRRDAQQAQDFKIANAHGRKLSSQYKLQVDINEEDFYIFGKGLVKSIQVMTDL